MRISQKYIFNTRPSSLLLVAGKYTAELYSIRDSNVVHIGNIRTESDTYSDHEGFFELRDDFRIKSFLHLLEERLKTLPYLQHVYLFAPPESLQKIKDTLPLNLRLKVAGEIKGNFTKRHPVELLHLLTRQRMGGGGPKIPLPERAAKILARKPTERPGKRHII